MITRILGSMLLGVSLLASSAAHAVPMQPIEEVFEPAAPAEPNKFVKIAAIQWAPPSAVLVKTSEEAETFKTRNRELLAARIREAADKGAKIIITSEMGVIGYPDIPGIPPEDMNFNTREEMLPFTEKVPDGPSTLYFQALAKELGVYIQFGTAEIDGDIQSGNLHNTAVVVGPNGEFIAKHRKVSLFHQESIYFTPGVSGTIYDSPAGKIGMMLCADVYEPLVEDFYRGKVQAMALSTSWDAMNSGWSQFTSTAKYVNAAMIAANQPYFPDSGVANADGTTQSHIRQTDGIAYGYLPLVAAAAPQPSPAPTPAPSPVPPTQEAPAQDAPKSGPQKAPHKAPKKTHKKKHAKNKKHAAKKKSTKKSLLDESDVQPDLAPTVSEN